MLLFVTYLFVVANTQLTHNAGITQLSSLQTIYHSVATSTQLSQQVFIQVPSSGIPIILQSCPGCVNEQAEINGDLQMFGTISNYQTCGALVVSAQLRTGIQSILFKAGNYSWYVFRDTQITGGIDVAQVTPLVKSCAVLEVLAGSSWNGSFTLIITPYSGQISQGQILIPSNTSNLDVATYPEVIPVTLSCPGLVISCTPGTPNPKPCPLFNTPSSDDPLFYYLRTLSNNRIGQVLLNPSNIAGNPAGVPPNSISTIIWTDYFLASNLAAGADFGAGSLVVDPDYDLLGSCTLQYGWLVDNSGVLINPSSLSSPGDSTCDYESFIYAKSNFESVIQFLTANTSTINDPSIIYGVIDLGFATSQQVAWQNCLKYSRNLIDITNVSTTTSSLYCTQKHGTVAWDADPCCNSYQLLYKCCVPSNDTKIIKTYSVPKTPGPIWSQCADPKCLEQPLQSLSGLQTAQLFCTVNEPTSPAFTNDPWSFCLSSTYRIRGCVLDYACKTYSPNSLCNASESKCTVPCDPAVGCYQGDCTNEAEFGWVCTNFTSAIPSGNTPIGINSLLTSPPDITFQAFATCLLDQIDPFLSALIVREINQIAGNLSFYEKFQNRISVSDCLDPGGGSYLFTSWPYGVCPFLQGFCPLTACTSDNPATSTCLSACAVDYPAQGACVTKFDTYTYFTISRPNMCEIRLQDTGVNFVLWNTSFCGSFYSGYYVGNDPIAFRPYGPCQINKTFIDQNACYTDQCIPGLASNIPCVSYCYNPTLNSGTCVGLNRIWTTWIGPVTNSSQSTCIVANQTLGSCLSLSNSSWFQGVDYLPAQYNTQASCEAGACFRIRYGFVPEVPLDQCYSDICSSCITGLEPQCFDQTLCSQVPNCLGDIAGCTLTFNAVQIIGFNFQYVWTPNGLVALAATTDFCQFPTLIALGIIISSKALLINQTSCDNWASICVADPAANNVVPYGFTNLAEGYNLRNSIECTKCGGSYTSFFQWAGGYFRPHQRIFNTVWFPTHGSAVWKPVQGQILNQGLWTQLLQSARAVRLSTLFISQFQCLYGVESELLSIVSCSCGTSSGNGGNNSCQLGIPQITGNLIGYQLICEGVGKITAPRNITIDPYNFLVNGSDNCAFVQIKNIPYTQFTYRVKKRISSLGIESETDQALLESIYVYNSHKTVVGQLSGDGFSFSFSSPRYGSTNFTGAIICVPLTKSPIEWKLHNPPNTWDLASSDSANNFEAFVPIGLDLPISSTEACFEIDGKNVTYFIIRLYKNYQKVEIQDTWTSDELGLIISLAIAYACLFAVLAISLLSRITDLLATTETGLYDFALWAVSFMAFQCILRTIYFIGAPFGEFLSVNLSILFSDLPSLLFHFAVGLTSLLWAGIYNQATQGSKKLKYAGPIMVFYIVSLAIFFVALSIAFAVLQSRSTTFTCANSDLATKITPAESVALTYKIIYAFYSAILAATFLWQGILEVSLIRSIAANKATDPERLRMVQWLIVVFCITTILATGGLLIQAATAIYSIVGVISTTGKLVIIMTCELLPTCALAYLFRSGTFFSKIKSKIGTTTETGTKDSSEKSGTSDASSAIN